MTYGFYFNMQRCIGCGACQIACKDKFDFQECGPRPRRVDTYETGDFPNCSIFTMSIGCNHCDNPACTAVCPTGAMFKNDEGLVLHDDNVCIGCQSCVNACPYSAPQYIESKNIVQKCDTCHALREIGELPICVAACSQRALDFGDVDELRAKYGDDLVSECVAIESASTTNPNLLILPREASLSGECFPVIL
ncbi:DMSO reductase iron-sulfur subunit [Slackia heliotrinireducens]|uniref:Fe-S-cluster-containing hydrogenase subunit n=1 Tax=Slackia heliotrinireducens (strain ATCC 29202 / DSM 20476 / NCTC 11029 / RHS 1) TaxID=471855 RepID=C7N419_SLAHD|nr:4Fe-4S dicluster domain-containing protein [Slackia heliotrinireducens]ACV23755.1 Fe-S-cluster-containing hydrogenase subunit [Slackia heliotrinireducens DSM 20476]VEH03377.1 DMSO reductase iron-sulfur subunit [Slackia heliotrinireducens]